MTGRLPARDLALVATFAALIAVLGLPGQLNLFGNAVPVTAQTLGVMLAGALLGARRGALAVLVFDAVFLPGDLLKAGIAAVVTRAVVRAYPTAGLGTAEPRERAAAP